MNRTMKTRIAMGFAAVVMALTGSFVALGSAVAVHADIDTSIRPITRQVTPEVVDQWVEQHTIPT